MRSLLAHTSPSFPFSCKYTYGRDQLCWDISSREQIGPRPRGKCENGPQCIAHCVAHHECTGLTPKRLRPVWVSPGLLFCPHLPAKILLSCIRFLCNCHGEEQLSGGGASRLSFSNVDIALDQLHSHHQFHFLPPLTLEAVWPKAILCNTMKIKVVSSLGPSCQIFLK